MTAPSDGSSPQSLEARIRRRIAGEGPLTFAEFMRMALYDPQGGFYRHLPVGESGDFVTSPHVSPFFGRLVARQVEEFWELLGRPVPFEVIEAGAGDGTLAREILAGLSEPARSATRYTAVEQSAEGRRALAGLGVYATASLHDVVTADAGCLVANELLDNLPFHRLRGTDGGPVELFVGLDGPALALVEGPPSSDRVKCLAGDLRPGEEGVVSVEALDFLEQAATLFRRGYLWLVDYGSGAGPGGAQVHGYRRHRVEGDVLEAPGSRDITAGVDFQALGRRGMELGLHVFGPVTQREALLALGFREVDDRARALQVEALGDRRGIEALRAYSNRQRAGLLISPEGLGGFTVLCLAIGTDAEPWSMRLPVPVPRPLPVPGPRPLPVPGPRALPVDVAHHEEHAPQDGDEVRDEGTRKQGRDHRDV